ncbi:ThiF family adenylyltransferase [Citricoccus sp. I39-566]|uniref:ThiF family adenylyltransferase n=1 Tax=Citricoccus sp. I39-566 TaxID=3073268 RepID=UPI00286A062E|nr:ThiF family adenylyltransferase [Citricoccus sp. I39-566]WMY77152.1 ThiF family adenylyltransferase [Citricoccus sp. I39-566]
MSTPRLAADRTVRQRTLPQIGDSGQELLARATVAVVGAGGLGSPVIQYLAAAGIGTVHVIDDDTVELSNLNRQTLHGVDTLGRLKTDGAVAAAQRLSPETTVVPHPVRLGDANAHELLAGADVILDGSDSFTTRFIVHRAATALGLPVVYGALMQWNAQVTVFWSAPPETSGLPATVLTDLFEDSATTHAAPGCAEAGVLGAVVGITGSFMALEAVKLILGTGTPLLGRLLLIDGLAGTTTEIPLAAPSAVTAGSARPLGTDQGTTSAARLPRPGGGPAPIGPGQVDPQAAWLDVRRPEESRERPGPAGTLRLPLDQLLRLRTGPSVPLPADHPLAAVRSSGARLLPFCASGPRSLTAARHLAELGWPVAGYLDGGLPTTLPTPRAAPGAPAAGAHRG